MCGVNIFVDTKTYITKVFQEKIVKYFKVISVFKCKIKNVMCYVRYAYLCMYIERGKLLECWVGIKQYTTLYIYIFLYNTYNNITYRRQRRYVVSLGFKRCI